MLLRTVVSDDYSGTSCTTSVDHPPPMSFHYGGFGGAGSHDCRPPSVAVHSYNVNDDEDYNDQPDDDDLDHSRRRRRRLDSPASDTFLRQLPASLLRGDENWAAELICECAHALALAEEEEDADDHPSYDDNDDDARSRTRQLLWVLNELSSPYGTREQRLASAFLQCLFCRFSKSGAAAYSAAVHAASSDRSCSFDSLRRTALAFQEASPWATFGHVASNGAILEALEGEPRAHIIDLSDSLCTQWPTLLEALATRPEGAPALLRLTTVVFHEDLSGSGDGGGGRASALARVMEEVGARLERFARLMGVPFQFALVRHADLQGFLRHEAEVRADEEGPAAEALVVNCVQALHKMAAAGERQAALRAIRALAPKVVTVVEEDAEVGGAGISLGRSVSEAVRLYTALFESLDECLARTSGERLAVERAAGRSILRALAASSGEAGRERAAQWEERLTAAGFSAKGFSEDVVDDVRALLKRYGEGWSIAIPSGFGGASGYGGGSADCYAGFGGGGASSSAAAMSRHYSVTLTWRDRPVIFASAWFP